MALCTVDAHRYTRDDDQQLSRSRIIDDLVSSAAGISILNRNRCAVCMNTVGNCHETLVTISNNGDMTLKLNTRCNPWARFGPDVQAMKEAAYAISSYIPYSETTEDDIVEFLDKAWCRRDIPSSSPYTAVGCDMTESPGHFLVCEKQDTDQFCSNLIAVCIDMLRYGRDQVTNDAIEQHYLSEAILSSRPDARGMTTYKARMTIVKSALDILGPFFRKEYQSSSSSAVSPALP